MRKIDGFSIILLTTFKKQTTGKYVTKKMNLQHVGEQLFLGKKLGDAK